VGRKVVIFGSGGFAECAHFYLTHDSEHEVAAFTVNASHLDKETLLGLPVAQFEAIEQRFPPSEYAMFIAIGYARVNKLRADVYAQAKAKGYELVSYVSSKATTWPGLEIGDNSFVFEDNTIQAYASIGSDVVLWSGNHIGHHSRIGDHCFITSHVVVSGYVTIGAYTFIGVNATLRDSISIGESNVIGSGALIMKSTSNGQLYIAPRTKPDSRSSAEIGM
jgi:sugar O-acyltransferase (sialic acid O-acetyltransferase NeuD family)